MARHSGRRGQVLLNKVGTQPALVASLNNWKLDITTTKIDVTAFADSNKVVVPDLKSYKGSFAGFWDDAEDKVFATANFEGGGYFYGYPDATNAATKYAYGPIYMDASIDVPVSGAVTLTGTFEAAGAWFDNL